MEELLLLQRKLVDQSVYPLEEDASVDHLLAHFQRTILDLKQQEPSFWQLQAVEYIRDTLKKMVGERIRAAVDEEDPDDPTEAVETASKKTRASVELEQAMTKLQSDAEMELFRLEKLLHEPDERRLSSADRHFMERFWAKLPTRPPLKEQQPEDERGSGSMGEMGSCSFSMLTFDDDLNDISRSAMSFPCMEDFPMLVRRMQSQDRQERVSGLDELVQMPILEIIHSGPAFSGICSVIVSLFLDVDTQSERNDVAIQAKKLICDLSSQVEDATQFLELYWAVLDFIGTHLEGGQMFLERHSIVEQMDLQTIAVLDSFRVLLNLLVQITHHWVYFSAESIARVFHSTFRLLITYSKLETEVEAKLMCPLAVMLLIDENAGQWIKLWLINSPNPTQLFVALDESGFVADLLQYLSRFRPLAEIKVSQPSIALSEKRVVLGVLLMLSRLCEYSQGRELLCRWQRIPAHAYIKQRHTNWEKLMLETYSAENDAVYHVVRVTVSEQEPSEELEADYEHLGAEAIDALVLSVISLILTTPKSKRENDGGDISYDEKWTTSVLQSLATCLHDTQTGVSLDVMLKLLYGCLNGSFSETRNIRKIEDNSPWFPFRQSKAADEVFLVICHSILRRIGRGALTPLEVKDSGALILRMITSTKASKSSSKLLRSLLELCKYELQGIATSTLPHHDKSSKSCDISPIESICNLMASAETFRMAEELGIVDNLVQICTNSHPSYLHPPIIGSLFKNSAGICFVRSTPAASDACIDHVVKEWTRMELMELLGYLTIPAISAAFFTEDVFHVRKALNEAVALLQEHPDFTIAVNCSEGESPHDLQTSTGVLRLLQCCLSTQHTPVTLSSPYNPLTQFIVDTLAKHNHSCLRSSAAEDTCCVAFQLALALASSVPAMLAISNLFSELSILRLDERSITDCEWLSTEGPSLGPCSLLEQQLRYELECIGGPTEKYPRCDLFEFNGLLRHSNIACESPQKTDEHVPDFALLLHKKILKAVLEGAESSSSAPMDFVLISQASWELLGELESKAHVTNSAIIPKSMGKRTSLFGELIYSLVLSKRSRLEPINTDELNLGTITRERLDTFFPPDSARKLMNRLYKSYGRRLSLSVSSTLLHSITKKFGQLSMDCFPVTVLLLLYPKYEEEEILGFLSRCIASPSGAFLWPSSIALKNEDDSTDFAVPAVFKIAEAVEVILEREFPQVLRALQQCNCSLATIVQRWHSQHFWNFFDWENIVIYTYFSVLYGAEFQVYIIVAVFKHLEPVMRRLAAQYSPGSLTPFLLLIREPIRDFRFTPWRSLLLRLRSEYHDSLARILFPSV